MLRGGFEGIRDKGWWAVQLSLIVAALTSLRAHRRIGLET